MNLSWRDIRLDGLYDVPFDGQEVVQTTIRTRNVRATSFREAGLRVRDAESGELSAALGAEFLPDQSGQLTVLVLASDGEEAGPGRSQAFDMLGAATSSSAIGQLGAGVLRFDRGLVTPETPAELLAWLAQGVVSLLGVDAAALPEESLAELLGVAYEPHQPGDDFERPVQFADEEWAAPAVEPEPLEAVELPAESAEPRTDYEAIADVEPATVPDAGGWPEYAEPAPEVEEEPAPEAEAEELGEAELEMIRLLTEDVEDADAPVEAMEASIESREEMASIMREQIGDDAVDLLSDRDLALLVDALRGMGAEPAEGEGLPSLEEEFGPLPADRPAVQEWGASAAAPQDMEPEPAVDHAGDWLADYESLFESEAEPEIAGEREESAAWEDFAEVEPAPEPAPEPEWIDLVSEEPAAGPEWVVEASPVFEAEAEPEALETVEEPAEETWPEPVEGYEAEPPSAPPAAREDEAIPAGSAFRAGPVPLADFARTPHRPAATSVEPVAAAEPTAVDELDETRYQFPPRAEERELAGRPRQFYQCASCGEFSAEQVGDNSYRCFQCEAVIEYRFGDAPQRANHP